MRKLYIIMLCMFIHSWCLAAENTVVYVPESIKKIINSYSQEPCIASDTYCMPLEIMHNTLTTLLKQRDHENNQSEEQQKKITSLIGYLHDLESGDALIKKQDNELVCPLLEQTYQQVHALALSHDIIQEYDRITRALPNGQFNYLTVEKDTFIQGNLTVNGSISGGNVNLNTTNHAVQVGNAQKTLTSLAVGTNGQLLVGRTSANPKFVTPTVGAGLTLTSNPNQLTYGLSIPVSIARGGTNATSMATTNGTLYFDGTKLTTTSTGTAGQVLTSNGASAPTYQTVSGGGGEGFIGNTVFVDAVNGNDSTGAVNGPPCLTIANALTKAGVAAPAMVWIAPGTYDEASLTIPANVTVRGASTSSVTISKTVTSATDLITMGTNSSLQNVSLALTNVASNIQLRGVVFPTTTGTSAYVENINLTITDGGTGTVNGVYSGGTGTPSNSFQAVRNAIITVNSTNVGAGAKRGVLVDTVAHGFNVGNSTITVTGAGTGSYFGVETNVASSTCRVTGGTLSGTTTGGGTAADISQTLGTLTLAGGAVLENSTANSLGFAISGAPKTIEFGDGITGGYTVGTTKFVGVGFSSATAGPGNVNLLVSEKMVIRALNVSGPASTGAAPTSLTFVLQKNGINTGFSVTIASPDKTARKNDISVTFEAGDLIGLTATTAAAPTNYFITGTVECY